MSVSYEPAMLGRGAGGGGGSHGGGGGMRGGGGGHARAGGGGGMRGGSPHYGAHPGGHGHGLGLGHHGHGHGHGHGHHRRFRLGQWWAWFPGYGWIVDTTGECTAWGAPLAHTLELAPLLLEGGALLDESAGDPVSERWDDGRRYLFELAPGTTSVGFEGSNVVVRPCLDDGIAWPSGRVATLGDATSAAADASAQEVAQIQGQLGGALSPAELSTVVQTYTGLSGVQQQSITSLAASALHGTAPTWATMAPLVAGGLALTGVGAPVVAIVAAAIPIVAAILSALNIGASGKCDWNVGGVCFSGVIPYGPSDPTWKTWSAFLAGGFAQAAYPDYAGTIGCELPLLDHKIAQFSSPATLTPTGEGGRVTLGPGKASGGFNQYTPILGVNGQVVTGVAGGSGSSQGPAPSTDPTVLNVWLFLRTYYTLWQANAEQAINGHPYASDANLLAQVATSWNAAHASSSQYTFQPATVSLATVMVNQQAGNCYLQPETDLTDPATPTFVSLLLAGQIDGHGQPPLTINVGPMATPAGGSAGASSGSSSGAGTTVAAVAGGLGLLTLLGYLTHVPASIFGGRR